MFVNQMKQKSPIRIFEKSIHGGLGKGNLGIFMGRAGTGKTACLVYLALDDIIRENKVLHFGIGKSVDKIKVWYDEIASHLINTFHLSDSTEFMEKIEKNLIIMSYLNQTFSVAKMKASIVNASIQGDFKPNLIIIDNFNFEEASMAQIEEFKSIASEFDVEIWFSGRIHREDNIMDNQSMPSIPTTYQQFQDLLSVMVFLAPIKDAVFLRLLKDHSNHDLANLHVKLDPKTLLVKPRYV